eukprot:6477727-Amphidinium_carterae.1
MDPRGLGHGDTNAVAVVVARKVIYVVVHVAIIMYTVTCALDQRSEALRRARGAAPRPLGPLRADCEQPKGTVQPREGHEVRRSEEREDMPVQGTRGEVGVRALPGPSEPRVPRGSAGLPQYGPIEEPPLPRSREEIVEEQEAEAREARRQQAREQPRDGRLPRDPVAHTAAWEAAMDDEDNRFIRRMQRSRGIAREPRRADALHPHLDSSPENPNDFLSTSDDDSSLDRFDHEHYRRGGRAVRVEQPAQQAEQEEEEREQEAQEH